MYLTDTTTGLTAFMLHYLLLGLFLVIVINAAMEIKQRFGFRSEWGAKTLWALSATGVIVLSLEIGHIVALIQYVPEISIQEMFSGIYKSVYPIIWTASALALMIMGMRFKLKTLRVTSLSLFLITIIKL